MFQALGAIAIVAGPRLGAILVTAAPPIVRILNFAEFKIFLPVWALFLQGSWAIANLNPAGGFVRAKPGFPHVAQVFALGNRALAEGFIFDSFQ